MTDDIKKLEYLYKAKNVGGYFRCSICNAVSNERIETNLGDFKEDVSFTHDPKDGLHFICIDCADAVEDLRQDFEFMDSNEDDMIRKILTLDGQEDYSFNYDIEEGD